MYVDESTCSLVSIRNGRYYYFCSETCKDQFDRPEVEFKKLKVSLIISWALSILVFLLTYVIRFADYGIILFIAATIVQFYPGLRFYKGFMDAIRNKIGNMDTLIALGTSAAWIYSTIVIFFPKLFPSDNLYFDTSSIIISLVLTGNYVETIMKRKASNSVERLMELQPKIANLESNDEILQVPIEKVKVGDILLVRPGELIPTDGTIVSGETYVDESLITGESNPIFKKSGDKIIGGSKNLNGSFRMTAEKLWTDNTLSEIIALVESAHSEKVPIQRFADKVASYFVPAVTIIAVSSFLFWYLVAGVGITFSLLAMITVFIIACPCALGIATPAALIVSSGMASERGILIKGGENIELLNRIDTVIFDKTGTLTEGSFEVAMIKSMGNMKEEEILRLAAIAEKDTEHPVGKAILRHYGKEIPSPDSFQYFPGEGVIAYFGSNIAVGNSSLMDRLNILGCNNIHEEGTILYVAVDGRCEGYIILNDRIKDDAKKSIEELRTMGLEIWMLTGDNESQARKVANSLGIQNFRYGMKPEDKEKFIEELQKNGNYVAMVGDGINDAPALARADVGIAIGAGTDVAKETGGIVLIENRIQDIPYLIRIARKTMRKIKQNLAWALVYNAILIPVAAGVIVPLVGIGIYNTLPFLGGLAMAFSSTIVVSNSIILRAGKV